MARPLKKGLKYFNIDCIQEDNLNYIEAKHGITGYGVLVKLWRKIYMIEGYYTEWNNKNLYLFAREVGLDASVVTDIVNSCLEEGIFSAHMYHDYKVLTSRGIQKRYIKIVTEAKRKDCCLEEKYCLVDEASFAPEETLKKQEVRTQKKENEKKEKETKESSEAAPAAPAREQESSKEKNIEPYWKALVNVWFTFVKEKFGEPPLFAGEDPRHLKSIVNKLKRRAAAKNIEWTQAVAAERLQTFLDAAFADGWLSRHFLLKTLDAKFEEIGRRVKPSSPPVEKFDPKAALEQLHEQWKKVKPSQLKIDPRLVDCLHENGSVTVTTDHIAQAIHKRMQSLSGSNQARDLRLLQAYETNPDAAREADPHFVAVVKRVALLEYLYSLEMKRCAA